MSKARLVWIDPDNMAGLTDEFSACLVGTRAMHRIQPLILLPVTFDEDGEPVIHGANGARIKGGWTAGSFIGRLITLARQAKEHP